MAIQEQLFSINNSIDALTDRMAAIEQLLTNIYRPSGIIEVRGVVTSITPVKMREGANNVHIREVDGTVRWLRMHAMTAATLQIGQNIWVQGIYRIEKRNQREYHLIYVDSLDDIKILEKS